MRSRTPPHGTKRALRVGTPMSGASRRAQGPWRIFTEGGGCGGPMLVPPAAASADLRRARGARPPICAGRSQARRRLANSSSSSPRAPSCGRRRRRPRGGSAPVGSCCEVAAASSCLRPRGIFLDEPLLAGERTREACASRMSSLVHRGQPGSSSRSTRPASSRRCPDGRVGSRGGGRLPRSFRWFTGGRGRRRCRPGTGSRAGWCSGRARAGRRRAAAPSSGSAWTRPRAPPRGP